MGGCRHPRRPSREAVGEYRLTHTQVCQNRLPAPGELPPQAHHSSADVDSTLYAFTLHDIPSSHLWRDDLMHQSVAATDAALLLYSISDPPSLRLAQGLAERIVQSATASGRPYAVLLAGNKSDLDERRVDYIDGSRVAARIVGGVGVRTSFMEVSAVEGQVGGLLPRIGADVIYARGLCEQRKEFEELAREEERRRKRASGKRGLWARFSRVLFVRRVVA